MKVSIITASFNSADTIIKTFESVKNQNYNDIEFIVVDGGSNDSTISIINENERYISKFISEKDYGIYDALNKGINLASGDIIGFIHSDDFLESNDVLKEIVSMISFKNLDGVYGDLQYVDKYNTQKIKRNWKSCEFKTNLLKQGWMPPHPTLFLKKEVYEKHGLFDLSYRISADYDFILRIFNDLDLKFGYLPKVIIKMRIGGVSNRNLKNIIKKSREDYRAIRSNNIGNFLTLLRKNVSKIKQFF